MLHPGLIFALALVVLVVPVWRLRWPLPLALILAAFVAALLAGFWLPFRHLVEGGFGYLNLVLALFAGALFGQAMRAAGATEALADALVGLVRGRPLAVLGLAGALLFAGGMFVGIAGVAVLAVGVFAVPMLRRVGMDGTRAAAFVAVLATCGMIAPPVNVPAMMIADGVNMPFLAFARSLLLLSIPPALVALLWYARGLERAVPGGPSVRGGLAVGLLGLVLTLGFWTLLRSMPTVVPDPAVPLVLFIGALVALPLLGDGRLRQVLSATFAGTPLVLAAVLVSVGVAVQVMTLTGIRGWIVINVMSVMPPWAYLALAGMPVFGGVLTAMGAANVLGVPFAFAFIHQEMILNVGALSAIAALAEFVPPTAIAAALSAYVAGEPSIGAVIRASLVPMAAIALVALLMLVFAPTLTPYLV